jgi:phosphotransferase system enzyme I (PtsI)
MGYYPGNEELTMMERTFAGVGATPVSGTGVARWYLPDAELELPERSTRESVDVDTERQRFEKAQDRASADLETERDRAAELVGEAEATVFDAHAQFVTDPQIESAVESAIAEGMIAERAVADAFESHIERFERMDGRMAERADDLRDVRDRLLRILMNVERVSLSALPEGTVVLAERLTPSDTAKLDPDRIAGFATIAGGRTSHAAIFARSLALPAVVGVGERLEDVEEGTDVVVDGDDGRVIANPSEGTKSRAGEALGADIIDAPVSTQDGRDIKIAANVGTDAEVSPAAARGADGIGLFRTEFLFLDRESPPAEEEQFETYRNALEAFPDGRVIFRTLDIGGDKRIPYLELPDVANPFLGDRGIRRSLDADTTLFETQLRALLRAAGTDSGGEAAIMLPMVATLEEVLAARDVIASVTADLEADGHTPGEPEVGVMIETPAAALHADVLAEHVDFFSIGTNDLTQYVMAAERGNDRVKTLGDHRQPAVLRAIRRAVEGAEGSDCWVGMCGEMAGDPDVTELLIGLGLDELSMSAVTVPAVKQAVRDTDTAAARDLAGRALEARTREEVIEILGIE